MFIGSIIDHISAMNYFNLQYLISFNLYNYLNGKSYDNFYFTNEETDLERITDYDTVSELYFEQIGIKIPCHLEN